MGTPSKNVWRGLGGACAAVAAGVGVLFRGGGRLAEHEAPALQRLVRAEGQVASRLPGIKVPVVLTAAEAKAVAVPGRTVTPAAAAAERAAARPVAAAVTATPPRGLARVSVPGLAHADRLATLAATCGALRERVAGLYSRLPPAVARVAVERWARSRARVEELSATSTPEEVEDAARDQAAFGAYVERLEQLYG